MAILVIIVIMALVVGAFWVYYWLAGGVTFDTCYYHSIEETGELTEQEAADIATMSMVITVICC